MGPRLVLANVEGWKGEGKDQDQDNMHKTDLFQQVLNMALEMKLNPREGMINALVQVNIKFWEARTTFI